MATVAVAAQEARKFRNLFVEWRKRQGARVIAEPPESVGVDGMATFSRVPDEFLEVLDAEGMNYKTLPT